MLRALFGSKYESCHWDEAAFIASIKSFSKESAELQFFNADEEADNDTPLWNRFKSAIDTSLHLMKELFG